MSNKNMVIYKYPIGSDFILNLSLPKDAKILSIQLQKFIPVIWALFDNDAPKIDRKFIALPTGRVLDILPENCDLKSFIGTCQLCDGFVIHVFEIEDRK